MGTRELSTPAIKIEAVKAEQFATDLKVQAREMKRFQDGSVEFKFASIADAFRGTALTPVTPKYLAPVLVRRTTTPSDFDRWEEEQVF